MIPRNERVCLTCLYGGEITGDTIECRRRNTFIGHSTSWWCGEGIWEEWVDVLPPHEPSLHQWEYRSTPSNAVWRL
jgi:hypothetical protein